MAILDRVSGVRIGGRVTAAGVDADRRMFAATDGSDRVVQVPAAMLPLLKRADIRPPPSGPLSRSDVDAKLLGSDLSIEDRLKVKTVLRSVGLLRDCRSLTAPVGVCCTPPSTCGFRLPGGRLRGRLGSIR